jgi:hypothetical protein
MSRQNHPQKFPEDFKKCIRSDTVQGMQLTAEGPNV